MYNDNIEYLEFLRKNDIVISTEVVEHDSQIEDVVLNPNIDWQKVNRDYAINQICVIDDFLKPEYANRLKEFALFFSKKEDFYRDYAAINFYRHDKNRIWFPLLSNVVDESKKNMECLRRLKFERGWAFIYENESNGVNIHADEAAVNLNLWVTPEESIIFGPNKNGLDVWKIHPPKDWDYETYNRTPEKSALYILEKNAERISIPYKWNRLVMFNSMFFHKTQYVTSKPGYENRRINYTFLYK
jgi:hypothetical protein